MLRTRNTFRVLAFGAAFFGTACAPEADRKAPDPVHRIHLPPHEELEDIPPPELGSDDRLPDVAGRDLMLIDPVIVDDARAMPRGGWSFGSLVRSLQPPTATPENVSAFLESWLSTWPDADAEGAEAAARGAAFRDKVLCPWRNASTGRNDCEAGLLDPDAAPFELLSIANRMDLHQEDDCSDAGELRFVFGLKDVEAPFTVIMEYAVPTNELSVGDWARSWLAAARQPCTNADCDGYRNRVAFLTELTTDFGMGLPVELIEPTNEAPALEPLPPRAPLPPPAIPQDSPPGLMLTKAMASRMAPPQRTGSQLRHLRTHESLSGVTEMREYVLDTASGQLVQTIVAAAGVSTEAEPIPAEKCHACHTDAAAEGQRVAVGERFNVRPGLMPTSERLAPEIAAQLVGRQDRLQQLQRSECQQTNPNGGATRPVPW